jgi:hypothetical protein
MSLRQQVGLTPFTCHEHEEQTQQLGGAYVAIGLLKAYFLHKFVLVGLLSLSLQVEAQMEGEMRKCFDC